jgi:hypothetical protein
MIMSELALLNSAPLNCAHKFFFGIVAANVKLPGTSPWHLPAQLLQMVRKRTEHQEM